MLFPTIVISTLILIVLRAFIWRGSNKMTILITFCLSFSGAVFVGNQLFAYFDYVYTNKTISRFKYAETRGKHSNDPVILIVGASHSYRGIIVKDVQNSLKSNALHYNVVDLTIGGLGLLEQDYYLDEFLKRNAAPEIVMLEISKRFEDPMREFLRSGIDDRMLPILDLTRLNWILDYALKTNDYQNIPHILNLYSIRGLKVGYINLGVTYDTIPEKDQVFMYGIQSESKKKNSNFTVQDIIYWSKKDLGTIPSAILEPAVLNWHKNFRNYQLKKLKKTGVRKVIFYAPPMIPDAYHAYMKSMCSFLDCLKMNDNEMNKVMSGDYWYNSTHLNKKGAIVYSNWFGNSLMDRLRE